MLFKTSKIFKVGKKYLKIEKHTRGARGVWGLRPLMRSAANAGGVGGLPTFLASARKFFSAMYFSRFFHYGFVSENANVNL